MDLSFPINKLTTHISGLPTMAIPKFISTHKKFFFNLHGIKTIQNRFSIN